MDERSIALSEEFRRLVACGEKQERRVAELSKSHQKVRTTLDEFGRDIARAASALALLSMVGTVAGKSEMLVH